MLPDIQRDAVRRGVTSVGATGVTGYAYRTSEPAIAIATRADGTSVITGYAAVWNRYSQNLGGYVEQLRSDCFAVSLAEDDQIASYNHDYATLLGRRSAGTLELIPDAVGLRYEIPIDDGDPDHARVVRKIVRGDLKGSSFSFRYMPDGEEWSYTDEGSLLCTITRAQLLEVAPVVWPAYLATEESDYAVGLRSLAAREGRDIDELIDAAREGRLTDAVRSTQLETSEGGPTAARRLVLAQAQLRLAEISA